MIGLIKENPKVLALFSVSAAVLTAGLLYTYWPDGEAALPAMPETVDDAKALVNSEAYKNLSGEQRRPYVEKVSQLMGKMNDAQRQEMMKDGSMRNLGRELMRKMIRDRAHEYATASPERRKQIVEEDRARFEAMRGRRGGKDGKRGGGDSGSDKPTEAERDKRRKQSQDRIEEMVNEGNGQEFALMMEYFQAVKGDRGKR